MRMWPSMTTVMSSPGCACGGSAEPASQVSRKTSTLLLCSVAGRLETIVSRTFDSRAGASQVANARMTLDAHAHACACARVLHARVRVRVRACVRARVHARVHARVPARAHARAHDVRGDWEWSGTKTCGCGAQLETIRGALGARKVCGVPHPTACGRLSHYH